MNRSDAVFHAFRRISPCLGAGAFPVSLRALADSDQLRSQSRSRKTMRPDEVEGKRKWYKGKEGAETGPTMT